MKTSGRSDRRNSPAESGCQHAVLSFGALATRAGPAAAMTVLALADPTVATKPATLLSVGGDARDLGGVLRRADVAPTPERTDKCR